MHDLNDMLYFAEVVEQGSFAAAGRALGPPKSRLSRRIAELEDKLSRAEIIDVAKLTGSKTIKFGATVTLVGATAMKTETLPISIFLNLGSANIENAVALILILVVISLAALLSIRFITGRRYSI